MYAKREISEYMQKTQMCDEDLSIIMTIIEKLTHISVEQQNHISILTNAVATLQQAVVEIQRTAIDNFGEIASFSDDRETRQADFLDNDISSSNLSPNKKIGKTMH